VTCTILSGLFVINKDFNFDFVVGLCRVHRTLPRRLSWQSCQGRARKPQAERIFDKIVMTTSLKRGAGEALKPKRLQVKPNGREELFQMDRKLKKKSVVLSLNARRKLVFPIGFRNFHPGQRVYFEMAGAALVLSSRPTRVITGRIVSSLVRRANFKSGSICNFVETEAIVALLKVLVIGNEEVESGKATPAAQVIARLCAIERAEVIQLSLAYQEMLCTSAAAAAVTGFSCTYSSG